MVFVLRQSLLCSSDRPTTLKRNRAAGSEDEAEFTDSKPLYTYKYILYRPFILFNLNRVFGIYPLLEAKVNSLQFKLRRRHLTGWRKS